MLKMVLIVLALGVVGVVIALVFIVMSSDSNLPSEQGRLSDLSDWTRRLKATTEPEAFLVIELIDSGDFLQVSSSGEELQLDFPVVTSRQMELEVRVRAVYQALGLEVTVNRSTDQKDRFLDVSFSDARELADAATRVFVDAFGARPDSAVRFSWFGDLKRDSLTRR